MEPAESPRANRPKPLVVKRPGRLPPKHREKSVEFVCFEDVQDLLRVQQLVPIIGLSLLPLGGYLSVHRIRPWGEVPCLGQRGDDFGEPALHFRRANQLAQEQVTVRVEPSLQRSPAFRQVRLVHPAQLRRAEG